MKKSKILKVVLTIIAVLLFIILGNDYFKTKRDYSDVQKALKEKIQIVKKISDNNLQLNDRVVSKEAAEIVYKLQLDSLAQVLKVKPKTIIQTVEVNSKIDANLKGKTDTFFNSVNHTIDSLSFNYEDKWINVKGIVKSDSTSINIQGIDSLSITHYKARNKIVVDIRNSNKYIKLQGASTLTITESKPPLIQVKPYIGVGYDPIHKTIGPNIGVGLQFNIFR